MLDDGLHIIMVTFVQFFFQTLISFVALALFVPISFFFFLQNLPAQTLVSCFFFLPFIQNLLAQRW